MSQLTLIVSIGNYISQPAVYTICIRYFSLVSAVIPTYMIIMIHILAIPMTDLGFPDEKLYSGSLKQGVLRALPEALGYSILLSTEMPPPVATRFSHRVAI